MNFEGVEKWISGWILKRRPEKTEKNLTVTKPREK
jgi:hypothetical protein